jgi:hypothetical protein
MPQDYLEDSLRELFRNQPGYRRLCFRQKHNGPMCFVEVCGSLSPIDEILLTHDVVRGR